MINEATVKEILDAQNQNGDSPKDDETEQISRRSFLWMGAGAIGMVYAGAIGYPVYKYLATPAQRSAEAAAVTETTLDGADQLPLNSALMFKFGTKPAMLIRHEDGTFAAMEAVCTHLACTVKYEPENKRIFCACHGGVYDPKTGMNISGPPPKPLANYKVEVQDGRILIAKA
jgi:cytochrome b6-f complex iron-sulfur subunit